MKEKEESREEGRLTQSDNTTIYNKVIQSAPFLPDGQKGQNTTIQSWPWYGRKERRKEPCMF